MERGETLGADLIYRRGSTDVFSVSNGEYKSEEYLMGETMEAGTSDVLSGG